MASSTPGPDQSLKVKTGLKLNPSRRRVRVVGKIRGFTNQESEVLSQDSSSTPWITVSKPQKHGDSSETTITLSFLDQFNTNRYYILVIFTIFSFLQNFELPDSFFVYFFGVFGRGWLYKFLLVMLVAYGNYSLKKNMGRLKNIGVLLNLCLC